MLSSGLSMVELGSRLRGQRLARGLTLERFADLSEVSRSMVSEVERGVKTPSVLVLDRLATALGTSIARLLDEPSPEPGVVLRHAEQRVVRDPAGWERRILSPVLPGVEFEFMRTVIGPGVDAGAFDPHPQGSREYVVVDTGRLRLTINSEVYWMDTGDSAYYAGDRRHAFANDGTAECVYYLAMELGQPATAHRGPGDGGSNG